MSEKTKNNRGGSRATRGGAQPPACCCSACDDLLAECGSDLFPLYRKKLLTRGWAGTHSPVERRYVRRHRSEAAQKDAERRAVTMRRVRSKRQISSPQRARGVTTGSGGPAEPTVILSRGFAAATIEEN